MKKKLIVMAIISLFLFPLQTKAAEVALDLEKTLTAEGIAHDLGNYKETNEQAIIYMFRGNGCGYCHNFLEFLNSIVPEYGKYFKLVSYEVWENSDNSKLMKNVANFLEESANGVPFIIIGDKTFTGYSKNYDEQIKKAIKAQFDSKNSYDVLKEMEKEEKKNKSTGSSTLIIWNFVFVAVGTASILLYEDIKHKEAQKQIAKIKELLENTKKETDNKEEKEPKKEKKKTKR